MQEAAGGLEDDDGAYDWPPTPDHQDDDGEESVYEDDGDYEDDADELYDDDEERDGLGEEDDDEEEEEDEEEEDEGNEEERLEHQRDDEAMASALISSIQVALPVDQQPALPRGPVRMTDLGFRISQMVIARHTGSSAPVEPDAALADADDGDVLLEKTLSGRRKNKTGVRGRPKKVDFGFGKSTTVKLSPDVAKLMGKANIAYVQRNYSEAIPLFLEVIQQSSSSFEPYHTLGLIYEELGELEKAFGFYLLTANMTSDHGLDLWNKLTEIAVRLGRTREAVFCLSQVLRLGRVVDPRPYWIRSRLYLELRCYRMVVTSFGDLLRRQVGNIEAFQAVARLALRVNLAYDAARLFRSIFSKRPQHVTWSHLNLLCEMYLSTRNWDAVVQAVAEFGPALHRHSRRSLALGSLLADPGLEQIAEGLPVDIRVKLALAYVHGGRDPLPLGLDELALGLDVEQFPDLRLAMGEAFLAVKRHDAALVYLVPLLQHPDVPHPVAASPHACA